MRRSRVHWMIGLALAVIAAPAAAQQQKCACCKAAPAFERICKLEKIDVIIEDDCFGCQCVDFCIPGPSKRTCKRVECICHECDKQEHPPLKMGPKGGDCPPSPICSKPKKLCWWEFIPGCAKVHKRKILLRKTAAVKTCGWEWVVQCVCCGCAGKYPDVHVGPDGTPVLPSEAPAGEETPPIPPPPAIDAKLKYGGSRIVPASTEVHY